MTPKAIAGDWEGAKQRLLIWPSPVESSKMTADGFVVGWYRQAGSDPKWPAATMVVAGFVEREDDDKEISEAYVTLEKKLTLLRDKQRRNEFCSCQATPRLDATQIAHLRIVGFLTTLQVHDEPASITKAWLQKMNVPLIYSVDNYPKLLLPYWEQSQLVCYDPRKMYRHNLSSPGSAFGSILAQVSVACPVMVYLSKLETIADTTVDASSYPSEKSPSTIGLEDADTTPVGCFIQFLRRHSMFACHIRACSLSNGLARIPRIHLWTSLFDNQQRPADQCRHCCKTRLSTTIPHERVANQRIAHAADLISGTLMGLFLVGWSPWGQPVWSAFSSYFVEQSFLPEWLDWLESFPIGFKLNVAGTLAIGQEIRSLVLLRHAVLAFLLDKASDTKRFLQNYHGALRFGMLLTCTYLGGSGCLALAIDVVSLMTMHVAFLNEGFRHVYRTEFYLLATSWRLFRGKKLNVLRQRTDTMEYDSMQLLMGSILFVASLFLLTTVMVYYTFFTLLNLVVRTTTVALLWSAYAVLQDFPFGTCYLRLRYPGAYTSAVLIKEEKVVTDDASCSQHSLIVTIIEAIPESMGSTILQSVPTVTTRISALKSWLSSVLSDILSGAPTSRTPVEYLESTQQY
jgi:N-acetylglucosaminyl transferase component (Gpi1)